MEKFKTWSEVLEHLSGIAQMVEQVPRRTPTGTVSPALRRNLRRAINALTDAMIQTSRSRELQKMQLKGLITAKLRGLGEPETLARVQREMDQIK